MGFLRRNRTRAHHVKLREEAEGRTKDKGWKIRRNVVLVDDSVLRRGAPLQHGHEDSPNSGLAGK